jgi:hypothetical protein
LKPLPFFVLLGNIDKLGVFLNNITNELISHDGQCRVPVVRKWGHPWFYFGKLEKAVFFTNVKLRRLHRRFGHPATNRFCKMLEKAGHDPQSKELVEIAKFCHHYQLKSLHPRQFKFIIQDDCEFNYEIIVDVMH